MANATKLYRLGEVGTRLRCTSALLCRSGYRASPERLRDGAARLRDETLQRAGAKAMTGKPEPFPMI